MMVIIIFFPFRKILNVWRAYLYASTKYATFILAAFLSVSLSQSIYLAQKSFGNAKENNTVLS
jgi:hypothetical protein